MRSSVAVGLLLVSSMSIFGIYGRQAQNPNIPPGPEPVWVNGVEGVYDPDTGQFVPVTSPLFAETCDKIQQRRQDAINRNSGGWGNFWWYGNPGYYHSSHYYGGGYFGSPSGGSYGYHAAASSVRGGIGGTGHSFGASS
jgi:hypothetical protein